MLFSLFYAKKARLFSSVRSTSSENADYSWRMTKVPKKNVTNDNLKKKGARRMAVRAKAPSSCLKGWGSIPRAGTPPLYQKCQKSDIAPSAKFGDTLARQVNLVEKQLCGVFTCPVIQAVWEQSCKGWLEMPSTPLLWSSPGNG